LPVARFSPQVVAIEPLERALGDDNVLSLVALAVAATAPEAPALNASVPWWDKITMTMDSTGAEKACRYENSLSPALASGCETDDSGLPSKSAKTPNGVLTKVTFERRFSPGERPEPGRLQPGDTLIGRQLIHLSIDANGAVKGCKVVDVSGEVPDYGCKEAQTETFALKTNASASNLQQAFMTILVYGHAEQVV
jgi:hypothetical protein